jgi:hypothetical protein
MTAPLPSEEGLSTLVLTDLPPVQRKLIRFILRRVEPTYAELHQAVTNWPEGDRMSQAELEAALTTLREQHYLVELGDEAERRYKVSFSRRASRELTTGLWDSPGTAPLVEKPAPADAPPANPPSPGPTETPTST